MKARTEDHALLFVNGPYQLLTGLACVRKHLQGECKITVVLYDMKWQPELKRITQQIAQQFGLFVDAGPVELEKSTADNTKTYMFRSLVNHLTFYWYTRKTCKQYLFLPKIYGAPERAILLAAAQKKVVIFDDGYGQYIAPEAHFNKFDQLVYCMMGIGEKPRVNLLISPRSPNLARYTSFSNIKLAQDGYTFELMGLIHALSKQEVFTRALKDHAQVGQVVIIALPRMAYLNQIALQKDLMELFSSILKDFKNARFLLKPHPRDVIFDFAEFKTQLGKLPNWDFMPHQLWNYPLEVICEALKPAAVISGASTIGINADLLTDVKVMVYKFLSFKLDGYEQKAIEVMQKAGVYMGQTAAEAANDICNHLNTLLADKDQIRK